MKRALLTAAVLCLLASSVAQARFARLPAERVSEVPVERLLANIQRNHNLEPAQRARAIGRLHLIAYLRQTEKLMGYRDRPGEFAEGNIGDCAVLDKQSMGFSDGRDFPKAKPGELCEERSYHLGPKTEVPRPARRPPPNVHLTAAIAAYEEARRLEPDNLRTRLALAYSYDCANRLEDARVELRYILRRGLDLFPPQMRATNDGRERTYPVAPPPVAPDWDTHLVVGEAVTHMASIAVSAGDRKLVSTVRDRLNNTTPMRMVTPIFVPLVASDDVSAFVDRTSEVAFDFSGQGERMQLGWLTDKAAWLVWDPRHTGRIDSGFQMFGSVTWIAFWDNGYMPLGSLDDNGDGKLAGDELAGLALWRDANGNGISDPGEVKPLSNYDIVALRYTYERSSDDMWVAANGVEFANGDVRPTYDWQLHEPQRVAGR